MRNDVLFDGQPRVLRFHPCFVCGEGKSIIGFCGRRNNFPIVGCARLLSIAFGRTTKLFVHY